MFHANFEIDCVFGQRNPFRSIANGSIFEKPKNVVIKDDKALCERIKMVRGMSKQE